MTPVRLVSDTYAYFREHGHWPFVRTLQSEYGPKVSVRALAAEAGRRTITCQEGADGRCVLTLEALTKLPGAADDLQRLTDAVAFVAKHYEKSGTAQVSHAAIEGALGVHGTDLNRLGELLSLTSRLWSGGSFGGDTFYVQPSEDAFFFRDIKSFADYEAVRAQLDRQDRRVGELLSAEYARAHGVSNAGQSAVEEDTPSRYRLADDGLDELLQRDLAELAQIQSMGAWKSSAILAGSCLETLLYDVCKRHENACKKKWAGKWPDGVNASDLARFAVAQGWISEDHGQLATVLRRWRNIVHPHTAMQRNEPTKELADALVAVLRLLLADLVSSHAP